MAKRAGCLATFRPVPAAPGVQSAGECTVSGEVVGLRVVRRIDSADPWPTKNGAVVPNYVGTDWIVHARQVRTLDVVGARLAA